MKSNLFISFILLLISCSPVAKSEEIPAVNAIGTLRSIMHEGEFHSRARLDTLVKKGDYGIGASDSLRGELLILDGVVFESSVIDSTVVVAENPSAEATLFVYSSVTAWDTLEVSGLNDLASMLNVQPQKAPFVFQVIGRPEMLNYHVINFDPLISDFSNHKEGAYTGQLGGQEVTVLGFYATDAKGIYTHHDSDLHMHVLNSTHDQMGHVDEVIFGSGDFKLLVPKS